MTDAAAGTPADDLELLRRHEPIVRYTHGESFFPMDVGSYAARASLNVRLDDGTAREVVPAGKLDLQRLGTIQAEAVPGRYFLRVAREWTAAELGAGRLLRDRTEQARGFRRGPGRLTRVGYLSRLVDALFSLALLLRGRVPGALARDAVNEYRAMAEGQSTHAVLRPRGARGGLDRPPVLVLLRVQRLAHAASTAQTTTRPTGR